MALRIALVGFMLLGAMLAPAAFTYAVTCDILKLPAVQSDTTSKAPLYVIRKFGDRYYAAGVHGDIGFYFSPAANGTTGPLKDRDNISLTVSRTW